jgi:hypothetical protein
MSADKVVGYALVLATVLSIVAGVFFYAGISCSKPIVTVTERVEITSIIERTVTSTVTVQPATEGVTANFSALIESAYASGPQLIVNIENVGEVSIENVTASVIGLDAPLSLMAPVVIEPGQRVAVCFFLQEGCFEPGKVYTVLVTVYGGGQSKVFVFSVSAL